MKITLVCCPPWSYSMPPLSLAILQAHLKNQGHNVRIKDLNIDFHSKHRFWDRYIRFLSYNYSTALSRLFYYLSTLPKNYFDKESKSIVENNPGMLCFSVYKFNLLLSVYLAKKIKEVRPDIKIIFGGQAFQDIKIRDFVNKSESVDFIVDSEGEIALQKIIDKIENKETVTDDYKPVDINEEPTPDFSGFDMGKYKGKILPYSSSRGCFKKCSFCFDIVFWKGFRRKKADKIYHDLKKLKERHGIDYFLFSDSLMLGDKRNIERFCDLVISNGLKIKWRGQLRANELDEYLLRKMKAAGCVRVALGIESASQKVLNDMNKDSDIKNMENAIRTASNLGIKVHAKFIVGYPTENWSDFYETARFLRNNSRYISKSFFYPLYIYEGTNIHNNAEKLNIKLKRSMFWFSKGNNILIRYLRMIILNATDKISRKKALGMIN